MGGREVVGVFERNIVLDVGVPEVLAPEDMGPPAVMRPPEDEIPPACDPPPDREDETIAHRHGLIIRRGRAGAPMADYLNEEETAGGTNPPPRRAVVRTARWWLVIILLGLAAWGVLWWRLG